MTRRQESSRDRAMKIYKESSESYHRARLKWMRTEATDAEVVAMATSAEYICRTGGRDGMNPIIMQAAASANDRFNAWYFNRAQQGQG